MMATATVRRASKTNIKGLKGNKGNKAKGGAAGKDKARMKAGKRNTDSDSDYSYRSTYTPGGTRHVKRKKKNADGTYGDSESYHSSQDEDGEARRRKRRRDRDHLNSAHSYYSVVSPGGTRHVRRRRRREDGTYSDSESYHSADDKKEKKEGSESKESNDMVEDASSVSSVTSDSGASSEGDYSYASEVSEGGTRRTVKKQRIRDKDGKVIGYGASKPTKRDHREEKESIKPKRGSIVGGDLDLDQQIGGPTVNGEADPNATEGGNKEEEEVWPGAEHHIPSDFSDDSSSDDNVDLSNMTEEEKKEYFEKKEKRRQERERKRREKYGSKYDEIMERRERKRKEQLEKEREERERLKREQEQKEREEQEKLEQEMKGKFTRRESSFLRRQSSSSHLGKPNNRPKSMVTYEKGTPRDFGYSQKVDNREHGLSHDSWKKLEKGDGHSRRGSDSGESIEPGKLKREATMIKKLPIIPQGKVLTNDDIKGKKDKVKGGPSSNGTTLSDEDDYSIENQEKEEQEQKRRERKLRKQEEEKEEILEVGADGKMRLKKKKFDLQDLDNETLRKLGIDPSLSNVEIAKRLKALFGDQIQITDGGRIIGTKHVDDFDSDMDDDMLADQEDLDLTTLKGLRRVNVLFKRGGSAARRHLLRLLEECNLLEKAKSKKILDETEGIDFLNHYKLVDPDKIENYARAFVVEDSDFDTILKSNDTKIALDGIQGLRHLSEKELDYVFKVLHIDEATEVSFRMFAVISALCERVTSLDNLSKHLLEMCQLADLERKLDLYKAIFYHNIPSYIDSNFITSDSLKIELMAGGLNWNQQKYVMERMQPNKFGDISFLDYICYIPLFLSMHDNICDDPFDMSREKYQMPPRKRPPSAQRDMNPLGQPLKKDSTYLMRKQAQDLLEGKISAHAVSKDYLDVLNKYSKLPDINKKKSTDGEESSTTTEEYHDLIY